MRDLNLKDNFIEERNRNMFTNMADLMHIILSNNGINYTEVDSFVEVSLIVFELNNNVLTSMETVTSDNKRISFLNLFNSTLPFLEISNNFITDLGRLK